MDRRAMLLLAGRYASILEAHGAGVRRADINHRFDTDPDRAMLLSHARWQIAMVHRVIDRIGGEPTAIRLLGSVQGLLLANGLVTVAEVWHDNKRWLDGASIRAFDTAMDDLSATGMPASP